MISSVSPASFSTALSALRGPGGIAPRPAPALNAGPSLGAPSGAGMSPGANSPRGSLLDINA